MRRRDIRLEMDERRDEGVVVVVILLVLLPLPRRVPSLLPPMLVLKLPVPLLPLLRREVSPVVERMTSSSSPEPDDDDDLAVSKALAAGVVVVVVVVVLLELRPAIHLCKGREVGMLKELLRSEEEMDEAMDVAGVRVVVVVVEVDDDDDDDDTGGGVSDGGGNDEEAEEEEEEEEEGEG